MNVYGMVNGFWVVTKPSPVSEMGDICFRCTFEQFALQVRGGLKEHDILGIYADGDDARQAAAKLLGGYSVRTSDALMVELLVNIQVIPVTGDMTAGELSRAAAEAVGNAVRQAEEQGFQHRLKGMVEMGMGEVSVRNSLTLFG
jgi:hypothetical protein